MIQNLFDDVQRLDFILIFQQKNGEDPAEILKRRTCILSKLFSDFDREKTVKMLSKHQRLMKMCCLKFERISRLFAELGFSSQDLLANPDIYSRYFSTC